MNTVFLVGGFQPGQSLWSIKEGFERIGWQVIYIATRASIASHHARDVSLAREEADNICPPRDWSPPYADDNAFQKNLFRLLEDYEPKLLLWWFSKDDRCPGLIEHVRCQYHWCRTVTHTQDDPWDLRSSPHFSVGFEYAVTCCKESEAEYAANGIRAITLYPPPADSLHGRAVPTAGETCDFSLTILSIYAKSGGDPEAYLASADPIKRITHPIPFPDQHLLRQDVVNLLKDEGRLYIYGGLGYGTFPEVPRGAYRGFRNYFELPGIYAAARININHHNSPRAHGYLNQRDTAITGSGGFMLTDYVAGMEEVFAIGKEIDTYESEEELRDKARWWLAHDTLRQRGAQRAQARIHKEYGNISYAQKLLDFLGLSE